MVKRDGAETRKQRIAQIAKMVQAALHASNTGEISLSKSVAGFMYQMGLRKDKVIEYLEILQAMGQFEIDKVADKIRAIQNSV